MATHHQYLENLKKNALLYELLDSNSGLKQAGFVDMGVEKTPIGTRLNIYALRPGLVIGPRGKNVKDLSTLISTEFGYKDIMINAMEVQNPALNPKAIAVRLANALRKGAVFRRAMQNAINEAMAAGALGIEIKYQGKIRSERASFQKFTVGIVPKSGYPREAYTRSAVEHVQLKLGMYGIKVIVAYKGDFLNEMKLKEGEGGEENKGQQAQ